MFGAVAYGIEEGPQPLGVVTLYMERGGAGGGGSGEKGGEEEDTRKREICVKCYCKTQEEVEQGYTAGGVREVKLHIPANVGLQ